MVSLITKRARRRFFRAFIALAALLCMSVGLQAEDRKVQKRVAPVYPELARRMHVSGLVRILATVAPDGTVTEVKTVNGNKLLSLAAQEAVKKWKFVVGTSESTVTIDVSFDATN